MTSANPMPRQTFFLLAVLVVSSTRVLAGCSSGDDTHATEPDKIGYSEANAVYVTADASHVDVASVETSMSTAKVFVALHTDAQGAAPTLVMDLPTSTGDHTLRELHALLTVPGADDPEALDGTLTVHEVAAPCGTGACGRLTADLTLAPPSTTAHVGLTGTASLSYGEEVVTDSTGGSSGGCDRGSSNNPWAVGSYGGTR